MPKIWPKIVKSCLERDWQGQGAFEHFFWEANFRLLCFLASGDGIFDAANILSCLNIRTKKEQQIPLFTRGFVHKSHCRQEVSFFSCLSVSWTKASKYHCYECLYCSVITRASICLTSYLSTRAVVQHWHVSCFVKTLGQFKMITSAVPNLITHFQTGAGSISEWVSSQFGHHTYYLKSP